MITFLRNCSFVFLIFILSNQGYANEHFPFQAQVIKKSVNIRAGANTNFEKIDSLNLGDKITVLDKKFDWYKVRLPATAKAYIRADYLKILQNSTAQLIGDKVNIRALPNSNSSSLGLLTQGTVVKIVTQTNGWWQIEPPVEAVGWVRSDFLSQTVDAALTESSNTQQNNIALNKLAKQTSEVELTGKLTLLTVPLKDIYYQLEIDGKAVYYVKATVDLKIFKGAIVLVKGTVEDNHQQALPVLHLINISLLL